jgi:Chaperone of endosialidase
VCLVGDNRKTKRQTKRKELTPMKTVIKTSIVGPFLRPYFILTAIALGFLALSPGMRAVTPAPDGGYPGNNTAEGQNALLSLHTASINNTAVGWSSLKSDIIGTNNTAIGAGALLANTADGNTATGSAALYKNTLGDNNTAVGLVALYNNTTGGSNTATGAEALFSNTAGVQNTATGGQALYHNRTVNGISGDNNTADGFSALFHNSDGNNNTAIGAFALVVNTTGGQNTAIGVNALQLNMTGRNNTALGFQAGSGVTTASNVICIGTNGDNVDNSCYIGNIFGDTSSGGTAVFINSNGRLGTATSSRRFKEDIKPMERTSEALFALKPVTFRYKKALDPQGVAQFGLVAEEVEKVNPDLVVRDKDGKPYSVRYEQVNAMLLNEFLKEHRKVEEQQATISELKSTVTKEEKAFETTIAQFAARLKEQESKIQQVSAEVEMNKRSPHVVATNP